MIRHTVVFTLNHPAGSTEEIEFMDEARKLTAIPGVTCFEILKQVSPKCDFAYGISMEFANQAELDFYAAHPLHTAFVEKCWIPNVSDFQEIDYTGM
ncbi:MAG: Dabb family protein [Verrucomicrobiota bacterium]